MERRTALLEEVAGTAEQILGVLHTESWQPAVTTKSTQSVSETELLLSGSKAAVERLVQALRSRPLQPSVTHDLVKIYEFTIQKWERQITGRASALYDHLALTGHLDALDRQTLTGLVESQWQNGLDDLRKTLISTIDEELLVYQNDVTSASRSQAHLEDGVRGHRPEAIAILEKAFAHTTNITQAEKRKLAELSGLEPRQVVIW